MYYLHQKLDTQSGITVQEILYKSPCGKTMILGNALLGKDAKDTLIYLDSPVLSLAQFQNISNLIDLTVKEQNKQDIQP
jgi:riboflavin synthase